MYHMGVLPKREEGDGVSSGIFMSLLFLEGEALWHRNINVPELFGACYARASVVFPSVKIT